MRERGHVGHACHSRRAMRPSYARKFRPEGVAPPSREGAGATLRRARGMPGALCTHSLVCAWCSEYAHEYSQRGHRNRPAFPHAMVLTVYFVLSPAIGCFATVASRIKVLPGPVEPNEPPQDLTPASRRQDHTTSPSAAAPSSCVPEFAHGEQSALRFVRTPDAARVHRIPPRVRDDRDTPLVWDETAADMPVIWGKAEREYFSLWE